MRTFFIEVNVSNKEGSIFKLEVNTDTFKFFREIAERNHYLFNRDTLALIAEDYKKGEDAEIQLKRTNAEKLEGLVQLITPRDSIFLAGDMMQLVFSQEKNNIARYKFRIQNFGLISEEFDFFNIFESKL
jgi:hypothetical protein